MKKITEKEFRARLIEMLAFFTDYCKRNDITFYMLYGSLIGTMRHQGFIPWDDDIDITLPRPDYERLISEFNKSCNKYRIISIHTNELYTVPLAKIIDTETYLVQHYGFKEKVRLGAYIDVFILDGFSDNKEESKLHMKKCIELTKNWSHANHEFHYKGSSFIKDVLRRLYYLRAVYKGANYYLEKIDNNAKSYDYDNSNYVGNAMYPVYKYNEIFDKSYFSIPTVGEFEGVTVPIPNGYDNILTQLYGDWRTLPPIENQRTHHDFDCYVDL